jgi:queuine tRNA-ribosyltransferase
MKSLIGAAITRKSGIAMGQALSFTVEHQSHSCNARVGQVQTLHGAFTTPAFMAVGTRGTVKGLLPEQLRQAGCQIVLNNAYHMMLRPGDELVRDLGGVQRFMNWDGPILTDSGGYQAFSMADINSVDDQGVTFKSIIDGASVHLGPESSMAVQNNLGADIIMAFDDCPPSVDPQESAGVIRRMGGSIGRGRQANHAQRLQIAHERTVAWLERCVLAHRRAEEQSLFGIIQGGTDLDLRSASVEAICNIDLPGYAIGGVAVGEGPTEIRRVVEHTAPLLPSDKPRYLMGVGYEADLVAAVRAGIDMFDCVLPTRNGRNANAFTRKGPLRLRNAVCRDDQSVIEPGCQCMACRPSTGGHQEGGFSRSYLRHLFMAQEMLGPILVSLHNIHHFQSLMLDIREAIKEDSWSLLYERWPVLDRKRGCQSEPA